MLGQIELEKMSDYINEEYPKLFINNEQEFSYKGFDIQEDEQKFDDAVDLCIKSSVSCLEMIMRLSMIPAWTAVSFRN